MTCVLADSRLIGRKIPPPPLFMFIGFRSQLGLYLECPRCIHLAHDNLDQLNDFCFLKRLVVKQVDELLFRGDPVGLVLCGAKEGQELEVLPLRVDVIVGSVGTVDEAFDGVPVVVEDEEDRGQVVADHGADLLDGELQGAVAYKQDVSSVLLLLASGFRRGRRWMERGEGGAEEGGDRVPDGSPENLGDCSDVGWKSRVEDAKVGGSGLGDDDVVFLQQSSAYHWPEPVVGVAARLGFRAWRNGGSKLSETESKPEASAQEERREFLARAAKLSLAAPAAALLLRSKMAHAARVSGLN